jgi:hypothetical protein
LCAGFFAVSLFCGVNGSGGFMSASSLCGEPLFIVLGLGLVNVLVGAIFGAVIGLIVDGVKKKCPKKSSLSGRKSRAR